MVIASESGAVGDREARTSTALQMNFLGELVDPIQISDIRTHTLIIRIASLVPVFFSARMEKQNCFSPRYHAGMVRSAFVK